MEGMDNDLLSVLREHAYMEIARDKFLTVMFTEHGARVPLHWVEETDARIASVLSEEVLRQELSRRGQDTAGGN